MNTWASRMKCLRCKRSQESEEEYKNGRIGELKNSRMNVSA
jgi:hypothetical protein